LTLHVAVLDDYASVARGLGPWERLEDRAEVEFLAEHLAGEEALAARLARFDVVVAITAPPELRRERARVLVEPRERRLIPDEEKLRRADFAYVNDGTLEELDAFAADVIARLS
jgi:dephospho-CoA kinase